MSHLNLALAICYGTLAICCSCWLDLVLYWLYLSDGPVYRSVIPGQEISYSVVLLIAFIYISPGLTPVAQQYTQYKMSVPTYEAVKLPSHVETVLITGAGGMSIHMGSADDRIRRCSTYSTPP